MTKLYKLLNSVIFILKLHNYHLSVYILIKSEIAEKHPHQISIKTFSLLLKEKEIAFTKYFPAMLYQPFVPESHYFGRHLISEPSFRIRCHLHNIPPRLHTITR